MAEAWNAADLTTDYEDVETHFASLRLEGEGIVMGFTGVDLPDLNLVASRTLNTNLVETWRESEYLYNFLKRVMAGESASITVRSISFDGVGRPRVHRLFGTPLRGPNPGARLIAFRVPTGYVSSRDYQARLKSAAQTDVLTGAVNRRGFNEEIELALTTAATSGRRGAVIYMDLDDFKSVNDALGHAAGDELLISIKRCLSAHLRSDDVLARLGGDEFAVLLQDVASEGAMHVARSLLRAVREHHILVQGRVISNTLSIGVALYPEHGSTVAELLQHADMAMYSVKGNGRDDVALFQPQLPLDSVSGAVA